MSNPITQVRDEAVTASLTFLANLLGHVRGDQHREQHEDADFEVPAVHPVPQPPWVSRASMIRVVITGRRTKIAEKFMSSSPLQLPVLISTLAPG